MDNTAASRLLEALVPIVRAAGAAVMEVYRSDFAAREKADGSPLTEADARAETLITSALLELRPDIPVVAEEAAAGSLQAAPGRRFWLVDPLDGTREFIHRNGIGFCEGAAIKYLARWRAKGGIEDLKKARHFIDLLIEMEGKKPCP